MPAGTRGRVRRSPAGPAQPRSALRAAGVRAAAGGGARGGIAALRASGGARAVAAAGSAEDTAPVLRNPRAAGTSRSGTERAALHRGCRARPRQSPPTQPRPAPAAPRSAAPRPCRHSIYRCSSLLLLCFFLGVRCGVRFFPPQSVFFFFFKFTAGRPLQEKRRHLFQPSASKNPPTLPQKPSRYFIL